MAQKIQTKLHDTVTPEPVGRPLLINMRKISVEAAFNLVRHRTQLEHIFLIFREQY